MTVRADDRGVSPLIGVVLLFAIGVGVAATYQVEVVPAQSQAIEYEHTKAVSDELVSVRNAILEASTGSTRYAEVTLGTSYPAHWVALTPPPSTGTLQTSEAGSITVESAATGESIPELPTQFLEYEPDYAETDDAGSLRYENTVLVHDTDAANVSLTDQSLLTDETVRLVSLVGAVSENGAGRVALEAVPGEVETTSVADPVVTVPTALSEGDWETLLAGELNTTDELSVTDGTLELALTGTYEVTHAPVGIGQPLPAVPIADSPDDSPDEINPATPGDVRLAGEQLRNETSSEVLAQFVNKGEDTTITEARINFYNYQDPPGQRTFDRADLSIDGTTAGTLAFRDDYASLEPAIDLAGNGTDTTVAFNFHGGDPADDPQLSGDSWFVLTIGLDSGESGTYFVPIPDENERGQR